MGEADEGGRSSRSSMTPNLSLQLDKYPRDLLQRFMASTRRPYYAAVIPDDGTEELELNLGLSLGGRFGVDKSPKSKLIRSSSIAGFVPLPAPRGEESPTPPRGSYPPIMRTASLPTETEEEWRKRKELQTLRRMAAKKRRLEKQRSLNLKADKEGGGVEEAGASGRACNAVAPPFGLSSWAQAVLGGGDSGGATNSKGKGGLLGGGGRGSCRAVPGFGQQTSHGSAESLGGSSSGMSESDKQGSGSCSGARSPGSYQLMQDRLSNESAGSSGTKKNESSARAPRQDGEIPTRKSEPAQNRGKEIGTNAMEDMPCVFTKGNGPNGKHVEGILYKYGKGEEVRIMCVCHGSFLSPAEFVKHAGGDEVAHPLRHIVINPNPTTFTR